MKKTPKKELALIDKIIKYAVMFATAAFVSMALACNCSSSKSPQDSQNSTVAR